MLHFHLLNFDAEENMETVKAATNNRQSSQMLSSNLIVSQRVMNAESRVVMFRAFKFHSGNFIFMFYFLI